MTGPANDAATSVVFRLPRSAYLAVLFLVFCAAPLAFSESGAKDGEAAITWRVVFLLVPLIAIVFIARTATFVSADGIRVRAAFGSRTMPWSSVDGLSVTGRAVYAVQHDGSVRLPCVRTSDLAALARASGGALPQVREPVRKYAPSRRRR
jgi:hypothetical protein